MSRRLAVLFLAAVLVPVFVAEDAAAHRQGLRPGFERLLYDCSHDWGWEGGHPTDRGHDLVTLDVREGEVGGVAMVIFELNMVRALPGVFGAPYGTWERLVVKTPRLTLETTLESTGEWADGLRHDSGVVPAWLGPRKAGLSEGGGADNTLLAYEIGYTYEQLQVQTGENLLDYEVWSYYAQGNERRPADVMPGGYHSGTTKVEGCRKAPDHDPARDESHFRSDGFRVQRSDWTVATPEEETPGDESDPGETSPARKLLADFSFEPRWPRSLEEVRFVDRSVPGAADIVSWSWSLGGADSAEGKEVVQTYERPGRHLVRLVVTDAEGNAAEVTKEVVVANRAPVASFTFTPAAPRPGQAVTFQDASHDEDGDIVAWSWTFGEGARSSAAAPVHVFRTAGTYTVALTVVDDQGVTATASQEFLVGTGPEIQESPGAHGLLLAPLVVGAFLAARRLSRRP